MHTSPVLSDVAISAPFSVGEGSDFSGAVYIYSGSSGSIRTSPSQVHRRHVE